MKTIKTNNMKTMKTKTQTIKQAEIVNEISIKIEVHSFGQNSGWLNKTDTHVTKQKNGNAKFQYKGFETLKLNKIQSELLLKFADSLLTK